MLLHLQSSLQKHVRNMILGPLSLLALSAPVSAVAVDTSGCSPLLESFAEVQTQAGALLSVRAWKPRHEECWNRYEAAVAVTYRWVEEGMNVTGAEVYFWMKLNGRPVQVKTSGSCRQVTGSGVAKHTGRPWFDCRAEAQVPVLYDRTGLYEIEIAPRKSGTWDTRGFEQNYLFQL